MFELIQLLIIKDIWLIEDSLSFLALKLIRLLVSWQKIGEMRLGIGLISSVDQIIMSRS